MSKNTLLFVGSFVVICFVVFLVINMDSDKKNSVNDEKNIQQSEISDRKSVEQIGDGVYKVDSDASRVEWIGRATGKRHTGQVSIKNAEITFSGGIPVSGVIVFDMTSISNDDLTGKMQEQLVTHLKSEDFFAVADHPEAVLTIKNVQRTSNISTFQVVADLTIKGITQEIIFDAFSEAKNGAVLFSATPEIDRTRWDVNFGSQTVAQKIGDQLIDDMISFDVLFIGVSENTL